MEVAEKQTHIDQANSRFWDELCGTHMAKQLGITDHSPESLKKFDDAYMDIYPYLDKHLQIDTIASQRVLEIGLGFGTVGQRLAGAGAVYNGLDIAAKPVEMMNQRMAMIGNSGKAVQGSMIECPFPDEHFDRVISIGCFHHTGNMQACIDQTSRILKPGGTAMIMVYNRFSFRHWKKWPISTFKAALRDFGMSLKLESTTAQRKAYDAHDDSGEAAPETEFFSARDIKRIFNNFQKVDIIKENTDPLMIPFLKKGIRRERLLNTVLCEYLGLDLYIHAKK